MQGLHRQEYFSRVGESKDDNGFWNLCMAAPQEDRTVLYMEVRPDYD